MRQHYNLGQLIRSQYIDRIKFLRPSYNHSQIEVFSTIVDRAIDSATSQLAGLYPDGTGPILPIGLNSSLLVPPFKYSDDIGV
jgi:lysosomal acid phosphatase